MTISRIQRAILLALTLLSACAAADPSTGVATRRGEDVGSGMFGAFLDGQFAMGQADPAEAAAWYLRALAADPSSPELIQQAFLALPRQGLTQLLQPLLVAWAQAGAGHTEAAITTLAPLIDGQRFRGVYAL